MSESCHVWRGHVTDAWVTSHVCRGMSRRVSRHMSVRPVWASRVTYGWGMSHMQESHHIWVCHGTYEWVVSHKNGACHICMNIFTREWLRLVHIKRDICISKETYILEKRHMHESLHTWVTQTCTYQKRPMYLKRDLYTWKETYAWIASHVSDSDAHLNIMSQIHEHLNITPHINEHRVWPTPAES